MGNKYPPENPLVDAKSGNEEALAEVLDGVSSPLFDAAWHLTRDAEAAEVRVVAALRALIDEVRDGKPEDASISALGAAARHLFTPAHRDMEAGELMPPAGGPLHGLPLPLAWVAHLAMDLEGEDLAWAVGTEAAAEGVPSGGEAEALRAALDGDAAQVSLPRGLVDQAFAD